MNLVAWAISAALKTEKFYDLTGMITHLAMLGLTLGAGQLGPPGPRQYVASAMILIWTLRLGFFLFYRALKFGDSRFHEAVQKPMLYLVFFIMQVRAIVTTRSKNHITSLWCIDPFSPPPLYMLTREPPLSQTRITTQALWCAINALPVLIVNGSTHGSPALQPQDIIGPAMWAAGLTLECLADFTKLAFKRNPENKGKFIAVGVWAYTRYPNYGGEMLLWWGIFVFCTSILQNWEWIAVLSPLFTMLLLFKASGIPLQEKQQQERWGEDPEFVQYRESTTLLYPVPWKKYRASGLN